MYTLILENGETISLNTFIIWRGIKSDNEAALREHMLLSFNEPTQPNLLDAFFNTRNDPFTYILIKEREHALKEVLRIIPIMQVNYIKMTI